ncbi:hypothetical protein, partial [Pseudomonas sp. NPDC089758]|uniref:hypothetical protein n=1 Tax=Pseudomonas sp. NPDC089758 TaxID=3364473 RepID=UPI00380DA7C2
MTAQFSSLALYPWEQLSCSTSKAGAIPVGAGLPAMGRIAALDHLAHRHNSKGRFRFSLFRRNAP